MTNQIKISASLQDAQACMDERLEFLTHDEPFVLGMQLDRHAKLTQRESHIIRSNWLGDNRHALLGRQLESNGDRHR